MGRMIQSLERSGWELVHKVMGGVSRDREGLMTG